MRTYLTDTYKLHRVTQLGIWGRGIDLDRFSPVHRCAEFRVARLGVTDPDTAVICFCGRLVIEKRPDIFARVIQRLHKENVSFHALVIGAGPRQDVVKRLPNTTCIGWLDADELAVAYASADVFLFPSAVETFGNVTLEAAASGLPLVVEEACSGHLVTRNYNGYGCAADDVEAFYQATLSLVTNASKRKEYALNSRQASCQYEQKMIVRQMLANYTKVYDDFYSTLLTPVILTTLLTCALLGYAVEILTLETLALHLSNPPSFIYVLLNTYLVNPFFYASISNFCKMVYISWYFSTVAHALEAFYFAYLCRTKLKLGWMSTLKWFSMVLMVGYFVGWRIKEMVDVQAKEEKKRMEKKAS